MFYKPAYSTLTYKWQGNSQGNSLVKFAPFAFFLLFLLLTCHFSTFAQSDQHSVFSGFRGYVYDSSNAVITRALVRLSNLDTGLERIVTRGASGSFEFLAIRKSRYKLTATAFGFGASSQIAESDNLHQPIISELEGRITIKHMILSVLILALVSSAMAQSSTSATYTQSKKADSAAWNLLKSTRETSKNFPANFAGITADVVLNKNGKVAKGSLNYEVGKSGKFKIEGLDEETKGWLNEHAMSVIAHRRGGDFTKGGGRHPIMFGEDDNSHAGRRVELNDSMKSSYRVRNGQVAEIDCTMADSHFTITVLETTRTPDGKFLPRHFTVTYFDAQCGALRCSEAFTDVQPALSNFTTTKAVSAANRPRGNFHKHTFYVGGTL